MVREHRTSDAQLRIGDSLDSGFDASHRREMTKRLSLSQPLIAGVLGGFAGSCGCGFRRALAAGNLDRLAAGNFVAGIVRHLPEEISRQCGDDRNYDEPRWE